MAYFISKTCKYLEVAFLIITLATDPYLNSIHAVKSAHLAILYTRLSDPARACRAVAARRARAPPEEVSTAQSQAGTREAR